MAATASAHVHEGIGGLEVAAEGAEELVVGAVGVGGEVGGEGCPVVCGRRFRAATGVGLGVFFFHHIAPEFAGEH